MLRSGMFGDLNTRTMKFDRETSVDIFIQINLKKSTPSNVADLMSISAKVSKNISRESYIKKHLPAIAFRLRELETSATVWSFRDISAVINGLQYMDNNDQGVLDIIAIMTRISYHSISYKHSAKSDEIVFLLAGLQRISSVNDENKDVRGLISVITILMNNCHQKFRHQDMADVAYCLQGMNSDYIEVRELLSTVADKMKNSLGEFNASEISNCFYGLQGMSSDHVEVRNLITELTFKIRRRKENLLPRQILSTLYLSRRLSDDNIEVQNLLSILLTMLKGNKDSREERDAFKARGISNALFGLQRMSSDCRQVRDICGILAHKLPRTKDGLNVLGVCNIFTGLQGMNNESKEVRELLSATVSKIRSLKEAFTAKDLSTVLFGLQGMNCDSDEVKDLLYVMAIEIRKSQEIFQAKDICRAIYGIQGGNSEGVELSNVLSELVIKFKNCNCNDIDINDISRVLFSLKGLKTLLKSDDYISMIEILLVQLNKVIAIVIDEIVENDVPSAISKPTTTPKKKKNTKKLLFSKLTNLLKNPKNPPTPTTTAALPTISSPYDIFSTTFTITESESTESESESFGSESDSIHSFDSTPSTPTTTATFVTSVTDELIDETIDAIDSDNIDTSDSIDTTDDTTTAMLPTVPTPTPILPTPQYKLNTISTKDLVDFQKSLSYILPQIKEISTAENSTNWSDTYKGINNELKIRFEQSDEYYTPKINSYKSMNDNIIEIIKDMNHKKEINNVEIYTNHYLYNLFESNIVLKIPNRTNLNNDSNKIYKIINIEIEKNIQITKLFSVRRNEYLESQGIFLVNASNSVLDKMNRNELEGWVNKNVFDMISFFTR